jgi:tRNA (cmo5U34)-methyltransferase
VAPHRLRHNGRVAPVAHPHPLPSASWSDEHLVERYLRRVEGLAPRQAGEDVLRSVLPDRPASLLDLGCGDGRLAALALDARPSLARVVAVDSSSPMVARAQSRFAGDRRVTVRRWDMARPIEPLGHFDVIVSGSAIHHLEDHRKRDLLAEVAGQLTPDGLFANLEVVASATPELHEEFLRLIGRPADDPEDRLASTGDQLAWMRAAGLTQVDCLWRWRGFALLVGRRRGPFSGDTHEPD